MGLVDAVLAVLNPWWSGNRRKRELLSVLKTAGRYLADVEEFVSTRSAGQPASPPGVPIDPEGSWVRAHVRPVLACVGSASKLADTVDGIKWTRYFLAVEMVDAKRYKTKARDIRKTFSTACLKAAGWCCWVGVRLSTAEIRKELKPWRVGAES